MGGSYFRINIQAPASHNLTAEQLRASLGVAPESNIRTTPIGTHTSVQIGFPWERSDCGPVAFPATIDRSGGHLFAERFTGGWSLSSLASLVAGSYALSTLVRYHPTQWARLLNHEKGDTLMPLLEQLSNMVQTDFVKLLLWELGEPKRLIRG